MIKAKKNCNLSTNIFVRHTDILIKLMNMLYYMDT